MKKLFTLIVLFLMLFAVCACKDNPDTVPADTIITAATPTDSDDTSTPDTFPEPEYLTVPDLIGLSEQDAVVALGTKGISPSVRLTVSDAAIGSVCGLEYDGYTDDAGCHIVVNTTVTLLVSNGWQQAVDYEKDFSKTVFITIDDGPSKKYTETVLQTLADNDVKATFFVVGSYAKAYSELIEKMHDAGHLIGCHTYSHDMKKLYSSFDEFTADFEKWESVVRPIVGDDAAKVFRFAGGSLEAKRYEDEYTKISQYIYDKGYSVYDWTCTNNDVWAKTRNGSMTPDEYVKDSFLSTFKLVETKVTRPKIILIHETSKYSVGMLDWMIKNLKERGYSFATLDVLTDDWTH